MGLSLRTGTYGSYYGNDKYSSQALNTDQQKVNATYIAKYLSAAGWSLNAIAGVLGNMEAESSLNPGRWQSEAVGSTSAGYGLIQWTGSTIHTDWNGLNGRDYSTMDVNLEHLNTEAKHGTSWISKQKMLNGLGLGTLDPVDLSYSTFIKSTSTPFNLASVFAFYRERSGVVCYGFHMERYSSCSKNPSKCFTECINSKGCYKAKFGEAATEARAKVNRQNLCKIRGGNAEKWYTFLGGVSLGGGGFPFPARLDNKTFNVDILKKGNERPDYIKDYYQNTSGYYNGEFGIPNNSTGDGKGGNCTAYAYGRFWEIADCVKDLVGVDSKPTAALHGNAMDWYPNNKKANDYDYGLEPKLGAILCLGSDDGKGGHVAIVEQVTTEENGDTSIKCSESGYGYSAEGVMYIETRTRPKDAVKSEITNWGGSTHRPFLGFIYQHYDFEAGGGFGGTSHVKGINLTHVDAETIEGKGFLTIAGASQITCEIETRDINGNPIEIDTTGIALENLDSSSEETPGQDTGSGSEDNTTDDTATAGVLTMTIGTTQSSFSFRLTGLQPLIEYKLLFKASGGITSTTLDTDTEEEDTEEEDTE
jgi:surface antigen